jgi:hypothetical protein
MYVVVEIYLICEGKADWGCLGTGRWGEKLKIPETETEKRPEELRKEVQSLYA